jgi:hypothetical protein
VAYYGICFIVLRHLLAGGFTVPLVLLGLVLLANAFWSILFFRWRDLRASFLALYPLCRACGSAGRFPGPFVSARRGSVPVLLLLSRLCRVGGISFVAIKRPKDLTT